MAPSNVCWRALCATCRATCCMPSLDASCWSQAWNWLFISCGLWRSMVAIASVCGAPLRCRVDGVLWASTDSARRCFAAIPSRTMKLETSALVLIRSRCLWRRKSRARSRNGSGRVLRSTKNRFLTLRGVQRAPTRAEKSPPLVSMLPPNRPPSKVGRPLWPKKRRRIRIWTLEDGFATSHSDTIDTP